MRARGWTGRWDIDEGGFLRMVRDSRLFGNPFRMIAGGGIVGL